MAETNDTVLPYAELDETSQSEVVDPEPDPTAPYKSAIFRAWQELTEAKEEEKKLLVRKARLKASVDALWPLAFPDSTYPDITSLTLADAIRLMVQSCNERPITIKEIRGKLQDLGFDLSKYKNPLASIHTAATRMVDSEELSWVDDDGNKLTAGPEMKPVLKAEAGDVGAILGMMGENSAGEK
jgi:hypothetical protein